MDGGGGDATSTSTPVDNDHQLQAPGGGSGGGGGGGISGSGSGGSGLVFLAPAVIFGLLALVAVRRLRTLHSMEALLRAHSDRARQRDDAFFFGYGGGGGERVCRVCVCVKGAGCCVRVCWLWQGRGTAHLFAVCHDAPPHPNIKILPR